MKRKYFNIVAFAICMLLVGCSAEKESSGLSYCEIQTQRDDSNEIEHVRFDFEDLEHHLVDDANAHSENEDSLRIEPGESAMFRIIQNGSPLSLKNGDVITIAFQQSPAKRLKIESHGFEIEVTDSHPVVNIPISEDAVGEFTIRNLSSELVQVY